MRRALNVGSLLLASVAILGAIVYFVGFERTAEAVSQAGVGAFAAVGGLTATSILAQATAWAALNRPFGHRVRLRTLIAGVVVGQAGNILTPSTYLGGEAFRVAYAGRVAGLPYHEVAGTVVLAKYLELVSFILFFASSTIVAAASFRHTLFEDYPGVGMTMVAVAAVLLGFGVVMWVALARRWHPLTRVVTGLARVGLWSAFFARLRERTQEMEGQVSRVFCEEGRIWLVGFASFVVEHVCLFAKPLAFFLLGERLRLHLGELCLLFVVCQGLMAIQLTPSGVGTLDGGLIATFALLGLDSARDAATCMAFLLCLRLWDVVLIGVGALLAARVGAGILTAKAGAAKGIGIAEGRQPNDVH